MSNIPNYSIHFIESLKNSNNSIELPVETLNNIKIIDKELNKYFQFLLEKKPNSRKKKYTEKNEIFKNSNIKRKKIFESEDNIDIRNINALLNKINSTNYNSMKNDIFSKCKEKSILKYTIESMFKKAVSQPGYCKCYVKLYGELIELENSDNLVSKIIQDKCKNYLDIFNYKNEENLNQSEYDKICELNKQKDYISGYSQFISELFLNSIININQIEIFIKSLINNIEENKKIDKEYTYENINSLFIILKGIEKRIKEIGNYESIKKILIQFKGDENLSSKGKFKFMDIHDLLLNIN
jgi:hypothetical protein